MKIFEDIGEIEIITDNLNFYGVSYKGFILKMDLNFNVLDAKQIINYGNFYIF